MRYPLAFGLISPMFRHTRLPFAAATALLALVALGLFALGAREPAPGSVASESDGAIS